MKARDVVVLGAALAVYDVLATSLSGLMTDLIERLAELPLMPVLAWGTRDAGISIGLGDLLLAATFPLAMRKAFGRSAGRFALASTLAVISVMLTMVAAGAFETAVPAMVVLGTLMVAEYAWWRRRQPVERRTWEYLDAEPVRLRNEPPAALASPEPDLVLRLDSPPGSALTSVGRR